MPNPGDYKPKADHPWRSGYKTKFNTASLDSEDPIAPPAFSLRSFLKDLSDNFETYKVPGDDLIDREPKALIKIGDKKAAIWLIDFLKRYWINPVDPSLAE